MKSISQSVLIFALLVAVLATCSAPAQQNPTLKLASGKQVKILASGPVYGAGGKRLGWMLRYETTLKVSDMPALRKEVDEIWNAIKADAEKSKESSVIVSAVEKAQGFIIHKSSGYNFVFEKNKNGEWHCLDDDSSKP